MTDQAHTQSQTSQISESASEALPSLPEITPAMLKNAEAWTETDSDLEGLSPERAIGIKGMRYGSILCDTPRSKLWHTPESIDTIADIPYLPDGGYDKAAGQCRGHLLDLYLPHDAVVRGGKTLPVYSDIHGGGFTY